MNKPAITTAPQLHHGKNKYGQDCWQLIHNEGALTVCLEIRYHYGDPNEDPSHYRTVVADDDSEYMGSYRELMTHEDVNAAYAQIADMEGKDKAESWLTDLQAEYLVLSEHHLIHQIANELRQRWEAMLTLGLFAPSVTH